MRSEKEEIYALKSQATHYLKAEGQLASAGFHCFDNGNWAEVLEGAGYRFHCPCPPQDSATVIKLEEIEAKPRGASEPKLKDALHTVRIYLANRPHVDVYQWEKS